jgi:hypothetical protein
MHPIKEQRVEEPVQEVVVKYLHCAEVVVHHRSKWQDMIPPSGYPNSRERHQRILKSTCLSVRRFEKRSISQMRIQNLRS